MAIRDRWYKTAPDGTRIQSDRHGRGLRWQVSYRDDFEARQMAAWVDPLTVPRGWA